MAPDAPTGAPAVDYRALLEDERDQLLAKLSELGFANGARTGLEYDPNFADTSQVTAERGEAEALAQTLREALEEVEHAIDKLGDGSYGVCEGCGQPIGEARLEAKPAARFCIACASSH